MKKILLTGFSSFGNVAENPTAQIVKDFEFYSKQHQVEVHKEVYAVDFNLVENSYPILLESLQPDLIINIGVAVNKPTINLEAVAINEGFNPYEVSKEKTKSFTLEKGGPIALKSGLNLDLLAELICLEGVPCKRSAHAGTYLCNAILYHSLYWTNYKASKISQALFVHIPYTSELASKLCIKGQAYPSLPKEFIILALNKIINYFIQESQEGEILS